MENDNSAFFKEIVKDFFDEVVAEKIIEDEEVLKKLREFIETKPNPTANSLKSILFAEDV